MNEDTSATTISWYALNIDQALQQLDVDPSAGLAAAAVEARLQRFGPNALVERGGKKPWHILWEQLTSTLVVILIIAAGVSAIIGDRRTPSPSWRSSCSTPSWASSRSIAPSRPWPPSSNWRCRPCAFDGMARCKTCRPPSSCPAISCCSRQATRCLPMAAYSKPPTCASRKRSSPAKASPSKR